MHAILSPSWELSTEHAGSSYGHPVLVQRSSKQAFGPGDLVRVYPAWGFLPATKAVARLATLTRLDPQAQALVDRFVASVPPQ